MSIQNTFWIMTYFSSLYSILLSICMDKNHLTITYSCISLWWISSHLSLVSIFPPVFVYPAQTVFTVSEQSSQISRYSVACYHWFCIYFYHQSTFFLLYRYSVSFWIRVARPLRSAPVKWLSRHKRCRGSTIYSMVHLTVLPPTRCLSVPYTGNWSDLRVPLHAQLLYAWQDTTLWYLSILFTSGASPEPRPPWELMGLCLCWQRGYSSMDLITCTLCSAAFGAGVPSVFIQISF